MINKIKTDKVFIKDLDTGETTELSGVHNMVALTANAISVPPDMFNYPQEITIPFEVTGEKALLPILYDYITVQGTLNEIAQEVYRKILWHGHYETKHVDIVQIATHKKKRTNKKWAKRYGYICRVYFARRD